MGRKFLALATGVFIVLITAASAVAAPPTMQLSSWSPEVQGGLVVGGTRTVTVTSVSATTIDGVVFDLESAPCDCTIKKWDASTGNVEGPLWTIGRLAPSETATLTVEYIDADAVLAGTSGWEAPMVGRIASALAVVVVLAGLILSRPSRFRLPT